MKKYPRRSLICMGFSGVALALLIVLALTAYRDKHRRIESFAQLDSAYMISKEFDQKVHDEIVNILSS